MNSIEKYEEIIAEYGSMEAYRNAISLLRNESQSIETTTPIKQLMMKYTIIGIVVSLLGFIAGFAAIIIEPLLNLSTMQCIFYTVLSCAFVLASIIGGLIIIAVGDKGH